MLKDTTLAAIVRDEEDNPAWGVKIWLEATLPFVEKAVVVDTGSADNTLEILHDLKRKYSNLEVYERRFDNFADSRNFSLSKVKTKRAFILDADELLLPEEYERLEEFTKEYRRGSYGFVFKNIYSDAESINRIEGMQIERLFDVSGSKFRNGHDHGIYEYPVVPWRVSDGYTWVREEIATIKHFLPKERSLEWKKELWYKWGQVNEVQPQDHARRFGWKDRNPYREYFFMPEKEIAKKMPSFVDYSMRPL